MKRRRGERTGVVPNGEPRDVLDDGSCSSGSVTTRLSERPGLSHLVRAFRRLCAPVVDPGRVVGAFRNVLRYPRFLGEAFRYAHMEGAEPVRVVDLWPCLGDADPSTQSGGGQYFYQDVWALRKLAARPPKFHVDVGSRVDGFVGQATAITKGIFVDIRPVGYQLPDLVVVAGSLLALPFANESIPSLSCLHVLEHVGLGRYGDPLNPRGTEFAARELRRVLAPRGDLYVSVPIGTPRLQFNAHRIFAPRNVMELFGELDLLSFASIDDLGRFQVDASYEAYTDSRLALGLFHFCKRVDESA